MKLCERVWLQYEEKKRKIWTTIKQTKSFITFAYYWDAGWKINNIKKSLSHWSDISWQNLIVSRKGGVSKVLGSEWHLERLRQSSSESSNLNRPSNSIKVDKSSVTSFWKSSYSKVTMAQNCLQCYQHNFRSCKF